MLNNLKNSDFSRAKIVLMKSIRFSLTVLLLLTLQVSSFAQVPTADFMNSMGKMYVVVAVILAIFVGIILFLVFLDRRLTKIENQINDHG